jgi:hypothetical protein
MKQLYLFLFSEKNHQQLWEKYGYNIIPLKCTTIYLKSNPKLDNSGKKKKVSLDGMIFIEKKTRNSFKSNTNFFNSLMLLLYIYIYKMSMYPKLTQRQK